MPLDDIRDRSDKSKDRSTTTKEDREKVSGSLDSFRRLKQSHEANAAGNEPDPGSIEAFRRLSNREDPAATPPEKPAEKPFRPVGRQRIPGFESQDAFQETEQNDQQNEGDQGSQHDSLDDFRRLSKEPEDNRPKLVAPTLDRPDRSVPPDHFSEAEWRQTADALQGQFERSFAGASGGRKTGRFADHVRFSSDESEFAERAAAFYDPEKQEAVFRVGDRKRDWNHYAAHEMLHYLSDGSPEFSVDDPDLITYRTGLERSDKRGSQVVGVENRGINEGITEMYAQRLCARQGLPVDYTAYPEMVALAGSLESTYGPDELKAAYVQCRPELIQQEMDYYAGTGSWAEFSQLADKVNKGFDPKHMTAAEMELARTELKNAMYKAQDILNRYSLAKAGIYFV